MQTPQKNSAPQSVRKASKQHKPGTEQKAAQSDNDVLLVIPPLADEEQTTPKRTKKSRKTSNARRNGIHSDIGEMAEYQGQRPNSQHDRIKKTPAKVISDAYAGPTFHQSPAASALPMPSFLSKSVPNNAISTISETAGDTAEVRKEAAKDIEEKRDSTPLDFLFDAARQARGTPSGASPARLLSPQNQSPATTPAARREETDFPFEFEREEPKSVYATPFSQRLAASRTPQSTSEGGQSLTEEERRAKTAALKKALLNPSNDQLGPTFNDSNPFNAKNAPVSTNPPRHASNPSTPYTNGYYPSQNSYFQYGAQNSPTRNFTTAQNNNRPPSSGLRNVYNPMGTAPLSPPPTTMPEQRISTTRSPPVQPPRAALNFGAIYGNSSQTHSRPQSEGSQHGHNSKPSLEQGLDDLRKALNMSYLGQAS